MLDSTLVRRLATSLPALIIGGLFVAGGLATVGWFDYRATQREFLALVHAEATSVRETVAAAARTMHAAGLEAERELAQRLLSNARLLQEIDRRGALTDESLTRFVERHQVFRISIFSPTGERTATAGAPGLGTDPGSGAGAGPGSGVGPERGGTGRGRPPWAGARGGIREPGGAGESRRPPWAGGGAEGPRQPGGFAALTERLLRGDVDEAVSDLHTGRWPGQSRLIAGVRRANGGAILVNVDAREVAALQQQTSVDALLGDIVKSTGEVAYVAVRRPDGMNVHGTPPDGPLPDVEGTGPTETRTTADGRAVLDVSAPVVLDEGTDVVLHVGMWLDGLTRAERRSLSRLAMSLTGALLLGGLALGLVWMRQAYGVLSLRHARAEEALRRRDRLAAMGELASTVAHEVRNPLNAIAMSAQRLQREHLDADGEAQQADAGEARDLLGVIQNESRRINGTIEQFLAYARPPKLSRSTTALGHLVEQATDALRASTLTRGLTLEVDTRGAGDADVDATQLAQVVDNLVRNAMDATPAGGRIHVAVHSTDRRHEIAVADTGAGIAPSDVPRIFDLYFTTKPDGTGVGLAVSQQIVSAHGGTIEVDSEPGRGTTMRVVLPADDGESDA